MKSNRQLSIENPHRNHKFWHRVQVHCHSQESDAKRGQTPRIVEEAYRDAGYDCVFLTDHNKVTPSPEVSGILHIDSAEYGAGRHHALALGIGWPAEHQHHRDQSQGEGSIPDGNEDGIDLSSSCACSNIPKRLTHLAGSKNALAIVAHPNARHYCTGPICPRWCGVGWSPKEVVSYAQCYTGMEIFNANIALHRMWSLNRWDEVLGKASRKTWGLASDDCHDVRNERVFDRGWILVNSEIDPRDCHQHGLVEPDALREDMLRNIRTGNFCAVVRARGGRHEWRRTPGSKDGRPSLVVSHSQSQISVVADRPCDLIEFCAGSSSRRESVAESGTADFTYDIGDWEDYVRARVVQKRDDGQHYMVFSQPLSVRRD